MAQPSHISLKSRITINPKAILPNLKNLGQKYLYFTRKVWKKITLSRASTWEKVVALLIVFALPVSVSAGLVGALSSIFLKDAPLNSLSTSNKNIQTMTLLAAIAAPLSGDQNLHIPVVESDALVPETGPSGTGATLSSTHKTASDQINIYVVREGDTLSQISEMFDVTVNTIKWGNDLSSNTLKVGSTLVILPISGVRHTVVKGDTLVSLVKEYKGDLEEIMDYNNLAEGSSLAVGSVIIIPDGEVVSLAVSSSGSGIKPSSSSGLAEYSGYYMRPIVGGKKTQGIHGYNGVDLASYLGSPIMAAAAGEVIISKMGGWNGGYGNYVVIKHDNGTQTLYAHTNSNSVSVGDTVKQGEVIATMGSTGKATGVHLHFEIRGAKNPF